MDITTTVCDVCAAVSRPTERYTITRGDSKAEVDLCEVHGRPLDALLGDEKAGATRRSTPARSSGSTGRTRRAPVKTIAEVEASKRRR